MGLDRLKEIHKIRDFFENKRKTLFDNEDLNSVEKGVQSNFLSRLNSLSKSFEMKAGNLADQGKTADNLVKTAEKELEKLKKSFLKDLRADDFLTGGIYKKIAEKIKRL